MASVSHTTIPAATRASLGRPPIWKWLIAILVGFPIGGYLADLAMDGVDSVGAALAGASSRASSSGRQNGSL